MKKKILWTLGVLLGMLLIYTLFNQIDAKPDPTTFTIQYLPPANLNKDNGYYILWALYEPPQADISSEAIIGKYRRLFDPSGDFKKYTAEFDMQAYKRAHGDVADKLFAKTASLNKPVFFPGPAADRCRAILGQRAALEELRSKLQPYLARYRMLIENPLFADFGYPSFDCPIPNLLACLRTGRLYCQLSVLQALDGDWQGGFSNLLQNSQFAKRVLKSSCILITNLIAKAMLSESLIAMTSLMNQPQCPPEMFALVKAKLEPIRYEEYGSRLCFIGEFLATANAVKNELKQMSLITEGKMFRWILPLFTQKNRTINKMLSFQKQMMMIEQTPPWQWTGNLKEVIHSMNFPRGPFWWLQNPGGKVLLQFTQDTGWAAIIFKSYRVKTQYDMTRIAAELHLQYDPKLTVSENLQQLPAYRELTDPCSGQPYRWNEQLQLLYSIGPDRRDDGGRMSTQSTDGDYSLPVILYIR